MHPRARLASLFRHIIAPLLFASVVSLAHAQTSPKQRSPSGDASWTKIYATDCGTAMKHPCPPSSTGYENEFNGDPRLLPLLQHSLPQRESWWVNGYGGYAPVSSIVQEFIGVPKDLFVDDDRYVTATGCVPHDCASNGMLWIDTGTQPATVVFVAEDPIESSTGGAGIHLWLYASKPLGFGALAPDLLARMQRWHSSLVASVQKLPQPDQSSFSQHVSVATLVQPNGRMQDLTYDMLFYKQNEPQFHNPGAKQ
jgi:hypothetical protein